MRRIGSALLLGMVSACGPAGRDDGGEEGERVASTVRDAQGLRAALNPDFCTLVIAPARSKSLLSVFASSKRYVQQDPLKHMKVTGQTMDLVLPAAWASPIWELGVSPLRLDDDHAWVDSSGGDAHATFTAAVERIDGSVDDFSDPLAFPSGTSATSRAYVSQGSRRTGNGASGQWTDVDEVWIDDGAARITRTSVEPHFTVWARGFWKIRSVEVRLAETNDPLAPPLPADYTVATGLGKATGGDVTSWESQSRRANFATTADYLLLKVIVIAKPVNEPVETLEHQFWWKF